jgi:hypothetical protein
MITPVLKTLISRCSRKEDAGFTGNSQATRFNLKPCVKAIALTAGLVVLLPLLSGCGSSAFPVAKVTGRVICEGQPVGGCAVYFEPLRVGGSDASALVGQPAFAFTEPDGTFILSTVERGANDGAVVGMHRVRVGRGEAKCDCSMNDEKTLMEVEVKADGNNDFEIVLPKATAQDAARAKMDLQFDPPEEEEED